MARTTSDTRFESTAFTAAQELSPTDSLMQDDSIPDEQERPVTPEPAWTIPSSNVTDIENNWASALVSTYETPVENSLLGKTRDMATFMKWYCRQVNKTKLTQANFEGQAYEVVNWTNPEGYQVIIDVNRPLPLGGPPGHVTIQPQFFFNKDLEYLRYGSKGSNPALSISKMKAASYPDFGLELLVSEQMWIDDVCTYDISAKYGISHWWFNRQKFYIDRHDSPSRRKDVRTHMRILKRDFKNLYPRDFEYLNLLLLQGHLDHLPGLDKRMLSTAVKLWTRNLVIRQRVEDFQLGIESFQTQLNLTKPGWDATGYQFKHDYTIIDDGTLTRILEALDYRVKEFKVKRLNPGMNTRFWTEKDVTMSREFIAAIERRLKTRRIYQNLECFVGGRVRDIDYRLLQRTK
ncbi:hypothetical protein Tco_0846575 [Tanacetum coccineum]